MQVYSSPGRANNPYCLPDVEVWQEQRREFYCPRCRETYELPASFEYQVCFNCAGELKPGKVGKLAWWWWYCFPGCLPDSDVFGPYDTEKEARADWEAGGE